MAGIVLGPAWVWLQSRIGEYGAWGTAALTTVGSISLMILYPSTYNDVFWICGLWGFTSSGFFVMPGIIAGTTVHALRANHRIDSPPQQDINGTDSDVSAHDDFNSPTESPVESGYGDSYVDGEDMGSPVRYRVSLKDMGGQGTEPEGGTLRHRKASLTTPLTTAGKGGGVYSPPAVAESISQLRVRAPSPSSRGSRKGSMWSERDHGAESASSSAHYVVTAGAILFSARAVARRAAGGAQAWISAAVMSAYGVHRRSELSLEEGGEEVLWVLMFLVPSVCLSASAAWMWVWGRLVLRGSSRWLCCESV